MPFRSDPTIKNWFPDEETNLKVLETPVATPPERGFLGRTKDILRKKVEKVEEIADITRFPFLKGTTAREQTLPESILQTAGQAISGLGELGFEAAKTITPRFIKESIKEKGSEFLQTSIGQAGLRAAKKGIDAYSLWKNENPRAARSIEAVVNISEVIPTVKGIGVIAKGAKVTAPTIGKVAGKAAEPIEQRLIKQQLDEAIEVIKPELSKIEKTLAIEAGRGKVKGKIFPRAEIQPSKRDISIAQSVQDVVKKSNNFVDNIDAIQIKIAERSNVVRQALESNDTIFSIRTLRSAINTSKEDSRVIFGTDKTLERAYDSVLDEFIRLTQKRPQKLSELWLVRQEFDDIVERKFPRIFDREAGDNIRANAVLDVRRSVNDFIADSLPENNIYKKEIKEISNMYLAKTNIARKASSTIDKSITTRIMASLRRNPAVYGLTGGILTIAALTNILSNPLFIGSLVVYGSIKIGKTIITSRTVKEQLSNFLRLAERKLLIQERSAIRQLLDKLAE